MGNLPLKRWFWSSTINPNGSYHPYYCMRPIQGSDALSLWNLLSNHFEVIWYFKIGFYVETVETNSTRQRLFSMPSVNIRVLLLWCESLGYENVCCLIFMDYTLLGRIIKILSYIHSAKSSFCCFALHMAKFFLYWVWLRACGILLTSRISEYNSVLNIAFAVCTLTL